jgi:hypothetical protein
MGEKRRANALVNKTFQLASCIALEMGSFTDNLLKLTDFPFSLDNRKQTKFLKYA